MDRGNTTGLTLTPDTKVKAESGSRSSLDTSHTVTDGESTSSGSSSEDDGPASEDQTSTGGVTVNGAHTDLNQNCTGSPVASAEATRVKAVSMEGQQEGTTAKFTLDVDGSSSGDTGSVNGSNAGSDMTSADHHNNNNNDNNEDEVRRPTEEELLRQLEEANRKLEADEKSYPARVALSNTPGHSRKGSGSSIVSSTSSNSFYSPQNSNETDDPNGSSSETLWETWGKIINDWDSVKKRPAFLRELVRKGIPHEFRGMAWQYILGVHDSLWKQEYAEHMKKTSPCEKLIRRDIARTFPDHDFFKEKDGFGQESLFNVMKAYSLHDREVGYCQGSGFIVGLLLMQMPEEDAFAVLVRLMQDFRLRELFKPSMAELGLCMYKLECLIQELLPTLLVHFQTQNFDTSMYASSWFLTLYVTSLPLSLARRIMDLFVSEGMEMIFRVGVAILQSCQEDLLALDMEGLLKYLQKDLRSRFELDADQENLLHTAYNIKYSHKKMKKLEKEYTALKTKENEDQIELRRLRTENRLLRQRIENLEKESATLADKLVQDQVTWAQEVEQTYALKNELSVTRQQLQETQKKLLDSEDIIGDIRKRTRIIEDAVHLEESEERNMVKHLQEELIAVRLREAETAGTIKELRQKIADLEDTNIRLQRAPSNDVQQLQEELIAVKLREAEANLSLKELRMKVNEIESYWEAHMERVRQNSPKEKSSKAELRQLQEEVMSLKLKEARAVSDLKDAKQKLMELETQNQICTNQIRRMGDDNKELKQQLEEAAEREKDLRMNIKDLTRKLDDTESARREEAMLARIREAEYSQLLADLRQKIAQIDIQKEELLAAGQLHDKGESQDLENKLHDLQDEVLQLQLSMGDKRGHTSASIMTDSYMGNNSDEELDAEIKDSENLNQTLSDIIEGKSPSSSKTSLREGEDKYGTDSPRTMSQLSSSDSVAGSEDAEMGMGGHDTPGDVSSQLKQQHQGNAVVVSDDGAGGDGLALAAADGSRTATTAAEKLRSSDASTHSGESTVITDCDSLPRESTGTSDSDVQGKNYMPQSHITKTEHHANQGAHSGVGRGVVGCKPDITSPDSNFPPTWEMYEEVVVMDGEGSVKVTHTSAKVRGGSKERSGDYSNTDRSGVMVKRSRDECEVRHKVKDSQYEGQDERIPDVEIIYEPSCGAPSLVCGGCDSSEDSQFVLKESTV